MLTHTRPDTTPSRGRRIGIGALIGISPGLILLAVTFLFTSGEAQLSVGMGALVLAVGGAVTGAVLGARPGLAAGRTLVGAIVGALPGIASFFLVTRLAPFILIGGAILGGIVGGRLHPTEQPPPD